MEKKIFFLQIVKRNFKPLEIIKRNFKPLEIVKQVKDLKPFVWNTILL